MKTFKKNLVRTGMMLLLIAACSIAMPQNSFVTINGTLKDSKTGDKIRYATIAVPNTGIGTVSNSEGEFTLKINNALNAEIQAFS